MGIYTYKNSQNLLLIISQIRRERWSVQTLYYLRLQRVYIRVIDSGSINGNQFKTHGYPDLAKPLSAFVSQLDFVEISEMRSPRRPIVSITDSDFLRGNPSTGNREAAARLALFATSSKCLGDRLLCFSPANLHQLSASFDWKLDASSSA